jgi:hypothetical protein
VSDLGIFGGGLGSSAQPSQDELATLRERIREARVRAARRQQGWTEIEGERLEACGPAKFQWLHDIHTDAVYRISSGSFFEPGKATLVADRVAVTFFVDEEGDVLALDSVMPSWTEYMEKRAGRGQAASA